MKEIIAEIDFNKLIIGLIPTLSVLGTFLIMRSEKKTIKEEPLVGISKAASFLSKSVNISNVKSHEKYIYPQNRKMKILKIIGSICIIMSLVLTLYKIYIQ